MKFTSLPFKMLLTLVVLASIALAMTGAGSVQAQGDNPLVAGVSKQFAGKEIRLILANHPWQQAIQPLVPAFEQASGMSLRLENYFEDQLSQKLQIGLTSGTSQADAFMFRPLQEGRLFVKNGWVQDMSKYAANEKDWKWDDFTAASRDIMTIDKVVYGIPIVTEREMVYYRKDLFEKAGLKAPATLDELKAAAEKFTDKNAGMFGVVMRGQRSPSVTQFSSFLYSFGGTWLKDGKSALDSPEALKAYQFYGGLLKDYGPQGTLNMSWPQALAIFQQGKAAMWIDADVFYAQVIDPKASTVADKVGFAPFPAGAAGPKPYNVTSWAIGVNAKSANQDAVWEFIKWATSDKVVLALQQKGVPGARTSVWNSPDGLKGFPEDYAKVVAAQTKIGVGFDRPVVIRVGEARDIVGNPVVVAIQGGDIAAAVKEAHTKFNEFLDKDK